LTEPTSERSAPGVSAAGRSRPRPARRAERDEDDHEDRRRAPPRRWCRPRGGQSEFDHAWRSQRARGGDDSRRPDGRRAACAIEETIRPTPISARRWNSESHQSTLAPDERARAPAPQAGSRLGGRRSCAARRQLVAETGAGQPKGGGGTSSASCAVLPLAVGREERSWRRSAVTSRPSLPISSVSQARQLVLC